MIGSFDLGNITVVDRDLRCTVLAGTIERNEGGEGQCLEPSGAPPQTYKGAPDRERSGAPSPRRLLHGGGQLRASAPRGPRYRSPTRTHFGCIWGARLPGRSRTARGWANRARSAGAQRAEEQRVRLATSGSRRREGAQPRRLVRYLPGAGWRSAERVPHLHRWGACCITSRCPRSVHRLHHRRCSRSICQRSALSW
jgi:hypothetical protein